MSFSFSGQRGSLCLFFWSWGSLCHMMVKCFVWASMISPRSQPKIKTSAVLKLGKHTLLAIKEKSSWPKKKIPIAYMVHYRFQITTTHLTKKNHNPFDPKKLTTSHDQKKKANKRPYFDRSIIWSLLSFNWPKIFVLVFTKSNNNLVIMNVVTKNIKKDNIQLINKIKICDKKNNY